MNRVEVLMQGLNISEVQASLVSELISDIPNNKLKDFLVFRMKFIEPYRSQELVTKEALFEYQKIKIEHRLKSGEKVFETVEQINEYLQTHCKGKEIGYGLGAFKEYVVLALDREGNMLNTFYKPKGYPTQIDGESRQRVLEFLLENQNRIGVVKYISKVEVEEKEKAKELEYKQTILLEDKSDEINTRIAEMLKGSLEKIKVK